MGFRNQIWKLHSEPVFGLVLYCKWNKNIELKHATSNVLCFTAFTIIPVHFLKLLEFISDYFSARLAALAEFSAAYYLKYSLKWIWSYYYVPMQCEDAPLKPGINTYPISTSNQKEIKEAVFNCRNVKWHLLRCRCLVHDTHVHIVCSATGISSHNGFITRGQWHCVICGWTLVCPVCSESVRSSHGAILKTLIPAYIWKMRLL